MPRVRCMGSNCAGVVGVVGRAGAGSLVVEQAAAKLSKGARRSSRKAFIVKVAPSRMGY